MPLNIDWQQILLHLFNLSLLVGGLYFLLYGPVKKFMDKRAEQYKAADLEAAEHLNRAKELEQEWQRKRDGAEEEIRLERDRAQQEAADYRAAEMAAARETAQKLVAQAKKEAEAEKAAILEGANREILTLTEEAASKILHQSTAEAYDSFLELAERSDDHADDPSR